MEQLYQGHPPIQYGRPGRNRDRRYGQGPTSNPQWEPSNDYQMSGDGRNYGAPQNHPPLQNYGPPRQGERGDRISMNNRNYAPGGMDGSYGRGPGAYQGQETYGPSGQVQVLAMARVTRGMENLKGSHKGSRETGKESQGPMHRGDKLEMTK
ncbi:hypothetical protein I3760_06G146800 [Carya illinoinensis]|nr:hypothetical protein I3760_06G146800 [Carya illinoinensis]